MSIFADENTKIIVQGITGKQASFHTKRSIEYGTNIVGGVTPGKGGTVFLDLPVFDNVKDAIKATGATISIMFVPAKFVMNATKEAIDAGIELIICISDGVPIHDMIRIKTMLSNSKTKFIGPNTPGIIKPDNIRLGIFPESIHKKGRVGIISRSSTLTYEAVIQINKAGLGQSTVVGLGDDMIIGTDFIETVDKFMNDDDTDILVSIGTLGGNYEEDLAKYYKSSKNKKPIISFIASVGLQFFKKFGYAGDIITNGSITLEDKKEILKKAGIISIDNVTELYATLLEMKK